MNRRCTEVGLLADLFGLIDTGIDVVGVGYFFKNIASFFQIMAVITLDQIEKIDRKKYSVRQNDNVQNYGFCSNSNYNCSHFCQLRVLLPTIYVYLLIKSYILLLLLTL